MTCMACDRATNPITKVAPYRIGTKELGWGTILIVGCDKHVKLTLNALNSFYQDAEKFQNLLEK